MMQRSYLMPSHTTPQEEDVEWVKPLENIVNNLISNDDYQMKSLLDDLRKLNEGIEAEASRREQVLIDELVKKMNYFTARHDRPMRDAVISILAVERQSLKDQGSA